MQAVKALALAIVLMVAGATTASAQGRHSPTPDRLVTELTRLSIEAGGVVGVAAREVGARNTVSVNGDVAYPMASVFKVAVAGTVLARVDAGEISLEQLIAIPEDRRVPSEVIADRLIHPGVVLSVANLIELMLTESDNTATDVLFELAGGGEGTTGWLRRQSVVGQRVDRDTSALIRDYLGLPHEGVFSEVLRAYEVDHAPLAEVEDRPNASFDNDPRDTSTPLAMIDLLERITSGRALSADSTAFLLGVMRRCRTGQARLLGLLPSGTVVAHKTGTIGGTVNDAGIIDLPDGRQIVIAVFIKSSDAPVSDREQAIAEIARTIWDYYLTAR